MNVRNEPFHDMACVVKCEYPSEWRWKLCESQHEKKDISFGNKFDRVEGVTAKTKNVGFWNRTSRGLIKQFEAKH